MIANVILAFVIILCSISCISSEKWIVAFSTIAPRFKFCGNAVRSWLNQTFPPENILIFVNHNWDKKRLRRDQKPRFRFNRHLISHTEILRMQISKEFPLEYGSGLVSVVEMPLDYGPATKLVGVLMMLHQYEVDYWLIGDDDLIYQNDVISRYSKYYEMNPPTPHYGPIATFFNSEVFQFTALFNKNFEKTVYHIQGADTFVLPSIVLKRQSQYSYPLSYYQYSRMLLYLFPKCAAAIANDDYTISYTITAANLTIVSLWDRKNVYTVNDFDDPSELHIIGPTNVHLRGSVTSCLQYESINIMNMWNASTTL